MNAEARVVVCQRGCRRRYSVPRLFEEAGLLAALYTDSSASSRVGRLVHWFPWKSAGIKALATRQPGGIPSDKIFSFDGPLLARFTRGIFPDDLAPAYIKAGLQQATVVYSMYGEDLSFLVWAKARGAKIIVDVFVHPATNRMVAAEMHRCQRGEGNATLFNEQDEHSRTVFDLADILLCPSPWVADGVKAFAPACVHKVRVVPYGSSLQIKSAINESPTVGRLLFAGRNPLRKGLHHLAEAAFLVRRAGIKLEVRCAGVSSDEIEWMAHSDQLNALGALPMDQMHEEFGTADVFVLPSLSEGQAGVVLEAMASGCPVIATRESGVEFEKDCGVTIPAGDPPALARAITNVVQNRTWRNQLATGALRQAELFSTEAWKARLVQAVEELGKSQ